MIQTMNEILEEEHEEKSPKKGDKKTIWFERARAAFERLQLAWVRTSITILAFGVVVYEFFFNRLPSRKSPIFETFTGRELALVLYILSFLMLFLSLLQHIKSMKKLKESYPESRYSVAALLSMLLLILAFFLVSMLLWNG
jgi:uncharacterized membrane protein YidH (DUF202 family)